MRSTWEVEDALTGRIVARMAGTEEEALNIYDKFFGSEFMVVMAIGWSEGRTLSDGSMLHAYGWYDDERRLCFRVLKRDTELPLTYKKK